jgi:hypothetical protein
MDFSTHNVYFQVSVKIAVSYEPGCIDNDVYNIILTEQAMVQSDGSSLSTEIKRLKRLWVST